MKKIDSRFKNKTGSEYDLFSLVMPHQGLMQRGSVKEMFNRLNKGKKVSKILEIGFGTGITTSEILKTNMNIDLTSIDVEPKMMSRAIKELSGHDKKNYKLICVEALDYLRKQKAESLDAVISLFVLHNLPVKHRNLIIQQVYRVLKRGGVLVNGDKIAVDDPHLHKKHLDWQLGKFDIFEDIGKKKLKSLWTKHYLEDESPKLILKEKEYFDLLKQVGFRNSTLVKRYHLDAITVAIK